MGYYYEPEYYLEKIKENMSENLKGLAGSLAERIKAMDERLKKLESKG